MLIYGQMDNPKKHSDRFRFIPAERATITDIDIFLARLSRWFSTVNKSLLKVWTYANAVRYFTAGFSSTLWQLPVGYQRFAKFIWVRYLLLRIDIYSLYKQTNSSGKMECCQNNLGLRLISLFTVVVLYTTRTNTQLRLRAI